MKGSIAATIIALSSIVAAQSALPPSCALGCVLKSVGAAGCDATDYYCQCKTKQADIAKSLVPCLCKDSGCSASDLEKTNDVITEICTAALKAKGETYEAPPKADCAAGASSAPASSAPASSMPASSSSAVVVPVSSGSETSSATLAVSTPAGYSSATGSMPASGTSSAAMGTSSAPAVQTGAAAGFSVEKAVMGLAGLAAFAL